MSHALLLFSFGATRSMEDVPGFLQRISRGRISPERLAEVETHYALFQGRSPLLESARRLTQTLREIQPLPVYEGTLFMEPTVEDAFQQMLRDGVTEVSVLIPTPFGGYRGMYLQRLEALKHQLGERFPKMEILPPCSTRSEFLAAHVAAVRDALREVADLEKTVVVFSAHSVPVAVSEPYATEVRTACEAIFSQLPEVRCLIAWQSASTSGPSAWLEPDVCEVLKGLPRLGMAEVILVPLGFLLENMETAYDLDVEAVRTASECGLRVWRLPVLEQLWRCVGVVD